jgi:hypothetical protein
MYKETLKTKDLATKSRLSQDQVENKVNRICDAFLAVLERSQYKDAHLQNIITAHVSKTPPALETGLAMIGRLQGESQNFAVSHDTNLLQHLVIRSLTRLPNIFAFLRTSTNSTTRLWGCITWTSLC